VKSVSKFDALNTQNTPYVPKKKIARKSSNRRSLRPSSQRRRADSKEYQEDVTFA